VNPHFGTVVGCYPEACEYYSNGQQISFSLSLSAWWICPFQPANAYSLTGVKDSFQVNCPQQRFSLNLVVSLGSYLISYALFLNEK
jgi:hypothetical protein